MQWAYGVTTVSERFNTALPTTLRSLAKSGFDQPRLFIDGNSKFENCTLEQTVRQPRIGALGNWLLALWELYIRNPKADRYAIFQDDIIVSLNLRTYLEKTTHIHTKSFWNLYTVPQNSPSEILINDDWIKKFNIQTINPHTWYPSNQMCRGALGLVFNRPGVQALLTSRRMAAKPQHPTKGTRNIDGAVVNALNNAGFLEMVHHPSLIQHTGTESVIGNNYPSPSNTFQGEDYDLMTGAKS